MVNLFIKSPEHQKELNALHMTSSRFITKRYRSNRGFLFAIMLAVLALMGVMGVVVSRTLTSAKINEKAQLQQQNRQTLGNAIAGLRNGQFDVDGDEVVEPNSMDTSAVTGQTPPGGGGGYLPTKIVANDAYGRRLGYCAYARGEFAVSFGCIGDNTSTNTGWIRGSAAKIPYDDSVAFVVMSAGADGLFQTPCPIENTKAAAITGAGDDVVMALSYKQTTSIDTESLPDAFSSLSGSASKKLCRMNDSGKLECDITYPQVSCAANQTMFSETVSGVTTFSCKNLTSATICSDGQRLRWDGTTLTCTTVSTSGASACPAGTISRWNGTSFDCSAYIVSPKGIKGIKGPPGVCYDG
jgi:type II secretory pathway pseudopilin PulG